MEAEDVRHEGRLRLRRLYVSSADTLCVAKTHLVRPVSTAYHDALTVRIPPESHVLCTILDYVQIIEDIVRALALLGLPQSERIFHFDLDFQQDSGNTKTT